MSSPRPVDTSVIRFWQATGAVIGFFVVLFAWIAYTQDQGPNVAFTLSVVVMLAMTAPILWLMKRRPVGATLSWGEALASSTYVFLMLFWIYGVVPHQWLTYADSELAWRADRIVRGPDLGFTGGEGIFEWALPFTLTYLVIRDVVAVLIYAIGLVGNVALWVMWQNRGKEAEVAIARSEYGRPLVREGATTEGAMT